MTLGEALRTGDHGTMDDEDLKTALTELKQSQERLSEQIRTTGIAPPKDIWDKLGSIAPIVSGLLISTMAGYFTVSYNQQQLHLQEIQTIEKFIPHMLGSEAEKKAAILAMSKLGNTELAARFASLFASEGTVSALKSIATTGDSRDRTIAGQALEEALQKITEHYEFLKLQGQNVEAGAAAAHPQGADEQTPPLEPAGGSAPETAAAEPGDAPRAESGAPGSSEPAAVKPATSDHQESAAPGISSEM